MALNELELAQLIEAASQEGKGYQIPKKLLERQIEAFTRIHQIVDGDNPVDTRYLYRLYREWMPKPISFKLFLKKLRKLIKVKRTGQHYYVFIVAANVGLPDHYSFFNDLTARVMKKKKKRHYLGVFMLDKFQYYARILLPTGRYMPLGAYDRETMAAIAYDLAALQLYGKDAVLNFPYKWKRILNGEKDIPEVTKEAFKGKLWKILQAGKQKQDQES